MYVLYLLISIFVSRTMLRVMASYPASVGVESPCLVETVTADTVRSPPFSCQSLGRCSLTMPPGSKKNHCNKAWSNTFTNLSMGKSIINRRINSVFILTSVISNAEKRSQQWGMYGGGVQQEPILYYFNIHFHP